MQIVHIIIGKLKGDKMNGIHRVVHNLLLSQLALGHQSVLWGITFNPVHDYPPREYQTRLFQDYGKFKLSSAIEETILEHPLDTVFHFHGGFVPQYYLFANYLNLLGYKYVFTPHGSYNLLAMKKNKWVKFFYTQIFEKFLIKRAKYIHFVGESEMAATKKITSYKDSILIPNGQKRAFKPRIFKPYDGNKKIIFGFCGRLKMRTKGLDLLLKGFSNFVRGSGVKAELHITGNGEDLNLLKGLVRSLELEGYVRFLGAKFGKEKAKFYASLDYLVLCSRNEGLPGVVLEASALGVPSIVSKETNMANYIEKYYAGIVLQENTPIEISRVLRKACILKEDRIWRNMCINAQNMIGDCFNWLTIAKRLMKAYETK